MAIRKKKTPLVLVVTRKAACGVYVRVEEQPADFKPCKAGKVYIQRFGAPDFQAYQGKLYLYIRGTLSSSKEDHREFVIPKTYVEDIKAAVREYNATRGVKVSSTTPDVIC